jgi:hypothetical protein
MIDKWGVLRDALFLFTLLHLTGSWTFRGIKSKTQRFNASRDLPMNYLI